jgi:predicted Kef-type K+ transport protein
MMALAQEGSAVLYVGGALSMEVLLRYAQRSLPGSQTAVTCQVSGRLWKRWAQGALVLWGLSTLGLGVTGRYEGDRLQITMALTAFAIFWLALSGVLATLSLVAHPALAKRLEPGASEEKKAEWRLELRRAIRRMDRLLRVELSLALALAFVTAFLVASSEQP